MIIDNKEIEFSEGATILEVAKKAEIYIPTLCYFEGLEGYGACRLCLCKVEGSKKLLPACTTPANEGMVVTTKNDEIQQLRRELIKLILSEHPYSCLICENKEKCETLRTSLDKAGRIFGCFSCPNKEDCEIRKIIDYLEIEKVDYQLSYKNYPLQREDPFIEKDYNLCILCGRCVRVCNELRGIGAINFSDRGHDTKVSTAFELPYIDTNCQFCGACVDACPTGALSSKKTKWNIHYTDVKNSTCGFCSIGCGFKYFSVNGNLSDSIPDNESPINKGQGCLIGRFCTSEFNNGKSRLKFPSFKSNYKHIPSGWDDIVSKTVKKLKIFRPEEIAILASPNLTNESAFILNKFARQIIGTNKLFLPIKENKVNIFYNLLNDYLDTKNYKRSFEDIENSDYIILINADPQITHPTLLINLNKAKKRGAKIISLNLSKYNLSLETQKLLDFKLNLKRQDIIEAFVALNMNIFNNINLQEKSLENAEGFETWINNSNIQSKSDELENLYKELMNLLKQKENFNGLILFGFINHLSDAYIQNLLGLLVNLIILTNNKFHLIPLWNSGNIEGVYQNLFYNNQYKSAYEIFNEIENGKIKLLYLTERIENTGLLEKLDTIILQDIFPSKDLKYADIILPTCTFLEDSGTYTNSESKMLMINKNAKSKGDSMPDWKIFCELAHTYRDNNSLKFDYSNPDEIRHEMLRDNSYYKTSDKKSECKYKLFIPNLDENFKSSFEIYTQKSFNFRGEPIYNQVADLKNLIEYRTEKLKQIKKGDNGNEDVSKPQFKILYNEEIVPNIYKLIIKAPFIAAKAKPCNFIIIMKNEKSERIPLTLSDWNQEQGTITVYYQEKGLSTLELAKANEGEELFSVVGPLGKDVEFSNFGTVLLGGGCYGIGSIYPIARKLKELRNRVIVILESKNKLLFYLEKKFETLVDKVVYCTSDGSKGIKGKIETAISHVIEAEETIDRCYFIGCNYMMMEASEKTQSEGNIPTFVNLSTIMIDGTGMCGGCRVTLLKEGAEITKFACVDGPTFNGHNIKWDLLIKRNARFDVVEEQSYQTQSCKALENLHLEDENE